MNSHRFIDLEREPQYRWRVGWSGIRPRWVTLREQQMAYRMKSFGLALAAVLVVGATMASAAEALNWTATNGKYPTTATGGQTVVFEFKAGPRTITCKVVEFSGKLAAKEDPLTILNPKFEKCKADGGLGAKFTTNECELFLFAEGKLTIECFFLSSLEIDIFKSEKEAEEPEKTPVCGILTAPQGPLKGITWTNEGAGNASQVKGAFAVKPTYAVAGDKTVCGNNGTGEILGTTTFTGKFAGVAEGVDIG
jgi:hypothetical protein